MKPLALALGLLVAALPFSAEALCIRNTAPV